MREIKVEGKSKKKVVKNTEDTTTDSVNFVIFKRCGKARPYVSFPNSGAALKLVKFTSGKGLELKPGDVVNTAKGSQLLIVSTYPVNPNVFLDIVESTFEPLKVLGSEILGQMELTKIKPFDNEYSQEDGARLPIYSFNGRLFKYSEIVDALKAMGFSEETIENISVDSDDDYKLILPCYVQDILGIIKKEFCKLSDEAKKSDDRVIVKNESAQNPPMPTTDPITEAALEMERQYRDYYEGYYGNGGFSD